MQINKGLMHLLNIKTYSFCNKIFFIVWQSILSEISFQFAFYNKERIFMPLINFSGFSRRLIINLKISLSHSTQFGFHYSYFEKYSRINIFSDSIEVLINS